MYQNPDLAPQSAVATERRGPVLARFCRGCGGMYSLLVARHAGKPILGKDHVSAPCGHEGEVFADGADWWEPAVRVELPSAGDPAGETSQEADGS